MRLPICSAVATAILLLANLALADGMYMPPEDEGIGRLEDMTSPNQHVILVDRGDTQEMVVRVVVRGAPESFAWVLPIPAPPSTDPEVFDEGDAIFQLLYQRSAPEWVEAQDFFSEFGCGASDKGAGGSGPDEVQLLGRTIAGDLLIETLDAGSGTALQAWLATNRFVVPEGLAELAQPYVDDGWVFLAMKLVSGFDDEDAQLQVLHLTWPGKAPVFPLRLTRLNAAAEGTHVAMFVFADTQTDVAGMHTKFSNGSWDYGPDLCYEFEMACVGQDSAERKFLDSLGSSLWMTRLEGTFSGSKMEDLYPEPTKSKPYREIRTHYARREGTHSHRFAIGMLAVLALLVAAFGILKFVSTGSRA